MTDPSVPSQPAREPRFRFSLGSLFLWTAIVGLAITNLMTSRRLSQVQRELDAHQPLPAKEVARQFEKSTTLGPISVTVKDVRYSREKNSYKIDFSWTDATTNETWSSDVTLNSDGYGMYYGQIRNGPFIQPLGYKESFPVAVKTPSPLSE